jgi:hypothetical protein
MAYTLSSKVGDLIRDPVTLEVLEKEIPMLKMAEGMSLEALLVFPQAKQFGITKEMVLKVLAEINAKK